MKRVKRIEIIWYTKKRNINMALGEHEWHCTKWNEPVTEEQVLLIHLYEVSEQLNS